MKKIFAVIITILNVVMIFCGCSSDKSMVSSMQNQYIDYNTDMQITYGSEVDHAPVTKSDTGYYYMSWSGLEAMIIYVDASTQKATPLCSKPNCLHDDPETCDAYIGESGATSGSVTAGTTGLPMQYYDGCLYVFCGEYDESYTTFHKYILKMDADGTNREKATEYFDFEVMYWFIHQGYLYYVTDSSILRLSMDNLKGDPETVYTAEHYVKDSQNTFSDIAAYKNKFTLEVEDKDENGEGEGRYAVLIDLDTLEASRLKVDGEEASFKCFGEDFILTVVGRDVDKVRVLTYYKTDLDGKNPQKVLEQKGKEISSLKYDGKYYYGDNSSQLGDDKSKQVITVYDKDFNVIDTFKLPSTEAGRAGLLTAQDEDYFILENIDSSGEYTLVMADKSQIGSLNGAVLEYTELCKCEWAKETEKPYVEVDE